MYHLIEEKVENIYVVGQIYYQSLLTFFLQLYHILSLFLPCLQEVACRKEEEERKAREKQEEEEAKCLEKFQDADPLEQDELHTFTDTMLPGCFHLLDELPDTVYRVCDLIMTAIKRNGADYRDMILKQVVNQVSSPGAKKSLKGKNKALFFCVSLLRFI